MRKYQFKYGLGGNIGGLAGTLIGGPVGGYIGNIGGNLIESLFQKKPEIDPQTMAHTSSPFFQGTLQMAMGGYTNATPVQLEKGEMYKTPGETVKKTNATKTHEQMSENEITEILPENTKVYSNRVKMKSDKWKKLSGNNRYNQFLDSISKDNKKISPADMVDKIQKRYQTDNTMNSFNSENLKKQRLEDLTNKAFELNEMARKENKPGEYTWGGEVLGDGDNYYNGDYGNQYKGVPEELDEEAPVEKGGISEYALLAGGRTAAGLLSTLISNGQKQYKKVNIDPSQTQAMKEEIPVGNIFNRLASQYRTGVNSIQTQSSNAGTILGNIANMNAQLFNTTADIGTQIEQQNVGLYNQKKAALQALSNQQTAIDQQFEIDKTSLQNQKKLNWANLVSTTAEQFYQDYMNKQQSSIYQDMLAQYQKRYNVS